MHENDLRVLLLLIGIVFILYIFFSSKNKKKYKVYKTRNHIDINLITVNTSTIDSENFKKIYIDINTKTDFQIINKDIPKILSKPIQMKLPLVLNQEKRLIIINSLAKNYYNINQIYDFMEERSIIMNDIGYFEKFHLDKYKSFLKYSITNILNPGFLDKNKLKYLRIKGLSFFMQIPMILEPLSVFNEMLVDVKKFSKRNNGFLFDVHNSKLTNIMVKNFKKIVISYKNEQRK